VVAENQLAGVDNERGEPSVKLVEYAGDIQEPVDILDGFALIWLLRYMDVFVDLLQSNIRLNAKTNASSQRQCAPFWQMTRSKLYT